MLPSVSSMMSMSDVNKFCEPPVMVHLHLNTFIVHVMNVGASLNWLIGGTYIYDVVDTICQSLYITVA